MTTKKVVDYLDEDSVTVPGQNYALVSFVSKQGTRQKTDNEKIGIKIRGVFATKDEATAHIKRLMASDNMFDVYLVEMYKWLSAPPNNDDIEDHQYQEEYLQEMVKEYKESQMLAKQHFEERKKIVMEKGLDPVEAVPQDPQEPQKTN
jgi:hypothetical protein